MKAIDTHGYSLYGDDLKNLINNIKQDNLKFYQFYNTEISPNELAFFKYRSKYQYLDDKNWDKKVLNKTFYDIETFFDPKKAPDPIATPFGINSIAFYNNIKNTCYIYFLRDKDHSKYYQNEKDMEDGIQELYQSLIKDNPTYNIENIKIKVSLFNNEKELLKNYFEKINSLGTLFLIGFNSSRFDDPYTINRLIQLYGESKAFSIISDFSIKKYGQMIYELGDRIHVDILKLYMPVDSGGSGMGKSLPNYKLNTIAEVELKINKLDLEGDFNEIYKNNPIRFATYNMLDTILTVKLDQKLQFIEQLYSLAKYNKASVRATIMGRSFIFNYRNTGHYLVDENLLIRNNKFNKEIYYNPFEGI